MNPFPFFDDGSVMAIFAAVMAFQVDWQDPVAIRARPGAVAIGAGPTVGDWRFDGSEIRFNLVAPVSLGPVQPMLDLALTDGGDAWVGAGIYGDVPFTLGATPMYFSGSAVVGYFAQGADPAERAHPLQYRGTVELGLELASEDRLGLSWDHRSSNGRGAVNSGLEALQLRFTRRF